MIQFRYSRQEPARWLCTIEFHLEDGARLVRPEWFLGEGESPREAAYDAAKFACGRGAVQVSPEEIEASLILSETPA